MDGTKWVFILRGTQTNAYFPQHLKIYLMAPTKGHFICSAYCVIVWLSVVLKRTVVGDWDFDNLSRNHLKSHVNNQRCLGNDLSTTETKPTNGPLTDRLNFTYNRRTKNRPI